MERETRWWTGAVWKVDMIYNRHAVRMFVLGQLPAPVIGCCWWWRQGCENDDDDDSREWLCSIIVGTTIITWLSSWSWSLLYCELLFVLCVFVRENMLFYILNSWQSNDQPFDMFNHHETWHMEDTETFIAALDLKFHFKFLGQVMSIETALGCQHHDRHTEKHISYFSSALMVVLSQFEILKLLRRLHKTIWPTNSQCNHPKHAHKTNQTITPHNSWLRVEKQKMQVEFRNIPRFVTLLDCSAYGVAAPKSYDTLTAMAMLFAASVANTVKRAPSETGAWGEMRWLR